MPVDPVEIVAEILGEPAQSGFDPSTNDYYCPFKNLRCTKSPRRNGDSFELIPYPVCSILQRSGQYVCVCPKRFFEINFLNEVVRHCWPGEAPKNPQIAQEVKMHGFGNVDFVVANIESDGTIGQFLSIELQAIDITGSVRAAYNALLHGETLDQRPTYNLNWDNVYKRYITQLIRKGYSHHHWGTKIVAVLQDVVYENIRDRFPFMRQSNINDPTVNIIFLSYRFEKDEKGMFHPKLLEIEGTSHANLQQAALYAEPPSRDDFCNKILAAINR